MTAKKEILVLDDQYINKVCRYIENTSCKADMQINALISILEDVVESGVVKGETAEVLDLFMQRTRKLGGCIKALGTDYCNMLNSFKNEIDIVDKGLY